MKSELGGRMKGYAAISDLKLTPRSCVIIRVDGKNFHNYTKYCNKPFDNGIIDAMITATVETAQQMQGFKLGYIQSDEASFLLTDFDKLTTQGWFNYEINKMVSISASYFTMLFNKSTLYGKVAVFDSRAFVVPKEDVPNYFVWRQQDWTRNSLQMLASSVFTHKELDGKGATDMIEMLKEKGLSWSRLGEIYKNGTFITKDYEEFHQQWNYSDIEQQLWGWNGDVGQ